MAKSIPAIVTPEVLHWARGLDRITLEEIAQKLKVDVAKVEAWESGGEHPSIPQAKKLAKQYRVPFAYFYLPDTPQKIKRLDKVDYRTFGNFGIGEMSRELRWFLRDIEERRDTMIDLYEEAEMKPIPFTLKISTDTAEDVFADQIRKFLFLTEQVQIKLRKPETALSYCISKLEEQDFLVFQAAKILPKEMRGLSVAYDVFPIIALNRKDEPSARLFTLLHELVHILSRTSGICNDMSQDKAQIGKMELFCNKIAGLALVPTQQLMKNKNVALIQQYGLDDTYINALARDFAVSREVVIHRLWDIGLIERTTFFDILKRYSEEYAANKKRKKTDGFLPPALDKGTQVGKLYTKTVISAYHADKLSPREASNYLLGLHIKHFEAIERWCY
ncbi:MAG: XRE family transcriptional regulator [Oscillospiraceae bacterium]|nr:XRE family transcriptional regulator [Oscillospiraceae bacterium]